MIEFVCPGCLSSHVANEAFAGLRARCVVCGAFIRVPSESGKVAEAAAPPPASRSRAGAASRLLARELDDRDELNEDDIEDDDFDEDDELNEDDEFPSTRTPASAGKPTKVRRRPTATEIEEAAAWDMLDDESQTDPDDEGDAPTKPKRRAEPAAPPLDSAEQARKKRILIGSAVGVVCFALIGYFVFSGDKKPQVAAAPLPRQETPPPKDEQPPPPPKKPEPKKTPPVVGLAPAPHAAGPATGFTMAGLMAVRTEAPYEFDAKYAGQRLRISGTLRTVSEGSAILSDTAEDLGKNLQCALRSAGIAGMSPTDSPLRTGQPIVIEGEYAPNLRMMNCAIVATKDPGDDLYHGRTVELVGVVRVATAGSAEGIGGERFPTLILEPPTTDSPIAVRCLFRVTESDKLAKLKPGQPVTVRGECEGREFRVVRLHNCTIGGDDPPGDKVVQVTAERFFTVYEPFLLPLPRPDPGIPAITLGAEELVAAFDGNLRQANANYRSRLVQVTGRVLERNLPGRAVVFETGTNQKFRVQAVFTPPRFTLVKERDEAVMTVRGVCIGVHGGVIQIENAELIVTAAIETDVPRTTAEYLPFKPGGELVYEMLHPTKPRDNPITRLTIHFNEPDLVRATPVKLGTFPGATLFGDGVGQPRWTRDLTKLKTNLQTTQYRATTSVIELRDVPAPPAQPSSWWDPALKLGMKKGESWSSEMPDGRIVTYTVVDFTKDSQQRELLEVRRVTKHPKDPMAWEESIHTYARNLGEIRRVVAKHSTTGKAVATMEMRLVDTPAADPKEPTRK